MFRETRTMADFDVSRDTNHGILMFRETRTMAHEPWRLIKIQPQRGDPMVAKNIRRKKVL